MKPSINNNNLSYRSLTDDKTQTKENYPYYTTQNHQQNMKVPVVHNFEKDESYRKLCLQESALLPCPRTNCAGWREFYLRQKRTEKAALLCRPAKGISDTFEIILPTDLGHNPEDNIICDVTKYQCPLELSSINKTSMPEKTGPPDMSNKSAKVSPLQTRRQATAPLCYEGRVVCVDGDGRCLFRSITVCVAPLLQTARRYKENGVPIREKYAIAETQNADNLRAIMITHMNRHIDSYQNIDLHVLNADQTRKRFRSMEERLKSMSDTRAYAGEIEINALSAVIQRPVLVLDTNLHYINAYGAETNLDKTACVLRFTRLSNDVGHYDAVILNRDVTGSDLCKNSTSQGVEKCLVSDSS